MISGKVVALRGAAVPMAIYDADGLKHEFEAIVDTGFSGWLTLPADTISALGLPWRAQRRGLLADGTEVVYRSYEAKLAWDGRTVTVRVSGVGSEPMIGMRLMIGHRILIENIDGGAVTIERMS
jgi:clan AA aspartic protease